MYYNPYGEAGYYYDMFRQDAYFRLLHASYDAPAVDVYANGSIVARNLNYRGFTEYLRVPGGQYRIDVFPAGQTQNAVLSATINLIPRTIQTIAITDRLASLSLFPILSPSMPVPQGSLYLRFVHLSPDSPSVDVTLPSGAMLFQNTGYRQITNYTLVRPGNYTFLFRPTGTNNIILTVPNINLLPNRFYTIYLIGLSRGRPSLQVLIPLDGNSYIRV